MKPDDPAPVAPPRRAWAWRAHEQTLAPAAASNDGRVDAPQPVRTNTAAAAESRDCGVAQRRRPARRPSVSSLRPAPASSAERRFIYGVDCRAVLDMKVASTEPQGMNMGEAPRRRTKRAVRRTTKPGRVAERVAPRAPPSL